MNIINVQRDTRKKVYKYLDKKIIEEKFKDSHLKKQADDHFKKRLYKIGMEEWEAYLEDCISNDSFDDIFAALLQCIEEKVKDLFDPFSEFQEYLKELQFSDINESQWSVLDNFSNDFEEENHPVGYNDLIHLCCLPEADALESERKEKYYQELEASNVSLREELEDAKESYNDLKEELSKKEEKIEELKKELENTKSLKKENNKLIKEIDKYKQKLDSAKKNKSYSDDNFEYYSKKLSELLEVETSTLSARQIYSLLNELESKFYKMENVNKLEEILSAKFALFQSVKGE